MEELKPCPLCGRKPISYGDDGKFVMIAHGNTCPFCGYKGIMTMTYWNEYCETFFELFRERDEDRVELYLHIGEDVIKIEVPESERTGIYCKLMKHVVSGHSIKMVTFHGEVTK